MEAICYNQSMPYLLKLHNKIDPFFVLFSLIFITSLILRLVPTLGYNIPFTMDQARDMLEIRNIVIGKHPTLIGPTTSINGVFLGPFWYYFNIIPFILGRGDPSYLVYWTIFWEQLAGLIAFLYFRKRQPLFALIFSSLFLMSPLLFYATRFSWNANISPLFVLFYFLSLFAFLQNPQKKLPIILLGLFSGIVLQLEAAFGILLLPFALLLMFFLKPFFKRSLILLTTLTFTLLPQLLFELRHQFVMTQTLIGEFSGESAILGNKLDFLSTLYAHTNNFQNILHGAIETPPWLTSTFIVISIFIVIFHYRQKNNNSFDKTIFKVSASFIVFAFISYLFYPHDLKSWFIQGLIVPFLLLITIPFVETCRLKNFAWKALATVSLIGLLANTTVSQSKFINEDIFKLKGHQSLLKNEIAAIDWIYQEAGGKPFRAYNFIPSIYDYPYQYLFWWYGAVKYGYHPEKVTYLENVPQYIINNEIFWTKKLTRQEDSKTTTFLLIENDQGRSALKLSWLGNFSQYCTQKSYLFPWETEVRKLEQCF